jgi:hypothetical protein
MTLRDDVSCRAEARVGQILKANWRLESVLGIGGMATVYAATHRNRSRVAIKMLHPEVALSQDVTTRFLREGYVGNAVTHPGTVRVLDDDVTEDGAPFLVMELLEGESLGARLDREGRLPPFEVAQLGYQLLDVLSAAHAAHIVHRDLKPDNVMLVAKDGGSDFVKVLDFGIAKVTIAEPGPSEQALTRLNTVMGTPEYMSPEQARGEPVDHRADLYTVGVILYEMLAGTSPFRHEEFVVVLTKKLTEDPPALPAHVSPATRELVEKLLQRSPDDRPQTAADIISRVDSILGYSPAPSLAFAPVSGQGAQLRRGPGSSGVAFANTVVGEVPAALPGTSAIARLTALLPRLKTAFSRFKTALGPWLELGKRRIAVGPTHIPIGAIFGALLGLPVVLALAFAGASGSHEDHAGSPEKPVAAPVDDDVAELMKRAEDGDRAALTELQGRAESDKLAPAYLALGRGYFKIGQIGAGLHAYGAGGKLDPKLGDSNAVLGDLRRGLADAQNAQLALETASVLGAGGADFLYDVYDSNRSTNAGLSKQAKALLDSESVRAQQSAALKVLLELPDAKKDGCQAVRKLLPRLQESGDARALPQLSRLSERRGCGFLGLRDCFACLRSGNGKDFAAVQKAVAERPAPKVGG